MPTAAPSRAQQFLESADRVLNPFKTVEYGHKGPLRHTRSLHTNFKQKVEDTFNVFDGGTSYMSVRALFNFLELKPHATKQEKQRRLHAIRDTFKLNARPGIFDYLTLGIFRGLHLLFALSHDISGANSRDPVTNKLRPGVIVAKVLNFIPYMVLGTLHLIGNGIVRHAFSAAMTLLMLPVIGLAHGITSLIRHVMEKRLAKQLKVDEVTGSEEREVQTLSGATEKRQVTTYSTVTLQQALRGQPRATASVTRGSVTRGGATMAGDLTHYDDEYTTRDGRVFYLRFVPNKPKVANPGSGYDNPYATNPVIKQNSNHAKAYMAVSHPQTTRNKEDLQPYGRQYEYLHLFAQKRAAKRAERQQAQQQRRREI